MHWKKYFYFFLTDLNTYYANLEFSNLDGNDEVEVTLQQDGAPDTILDIPVNAVVGHVLQETSDIKPRPVEVIAKEHGSMNTILKDNVDYRDEPSPIYIALGRDQASLSMLFFPMILLLLKSSGGFRGRQNQTMKCVVNKIQ